MNTFHMDSSYLKYDIYHNYTAARLENISHNIMHMIHVQVISQYEYDILVITEC